MCVNHSNLFKILAAPCGFEQFLNIILFQRLLYFCKYNSWFFNQKFIFEQKKKPNQHFISSHKNKAATAFPTQSKPIA